VHSIFVPRGPPCAALLDAPHVRGYLLYVGSGALLFGNAVGGAQFLALPAGCLAFVGDGGSGEPGQNWSCAIGRGDFADIGVAVWTCDFCDETVIARRTPLHYSSFLCALVAH
jgi:hypothetical protein